MFAARRAVGHAPLEKNVRGLWVQCFWLNGR